MDLIIHKLLAGRIIDSADVAALLRRIAQVAWTCILEGLAGPAQSPSPSTILREMFPSEPWGMNNFAAADCDLVPLGGDCRPKPTCSAVQFLRWAGDIPGGNHVP